jgi:hypothetical protein
MKTPPTGIVPIEFVTNDRMLEESSKCGTPVGHGKYETWERLHDSVCAVAARYGRASWDSDPLPDFYFSGDWFDEYRDSFALYSTKGLSAEALRDFQKAVAAHHSRASLHLAGIEEPINDLEILITSTGIFVKWDDESPARTRQRLEKLQIRLE